MFKSPIRDAEGSLAHFEALARTKDGLQVRLDHPSLYIDQDSSLVEFQRRVFEEAQDSSNPLLERVKFLSILGANMDEFGTIRFPELNRAAAGRVLELEDGISPSIHRRRVAREVNRLMNEARQYLRSHLIPELARAGISIVSYDGLSPLERETLKSHFKQVVQPVLRPSVFDPDQPFPHIPNLSFSLAILLRIDRKKKHFAHVRIPDSIPQLLRIEDCRHPFKQRFIWLDDLIVANLASVFPSADILEVERFRIMRDAEIAMANSAPAALPDAVEEGIRRRHFAPVAALVVAEAMSKHLLELMAHNLCVKPENIIRVAGLLPLRRLIELCQIRRTDLHDPPLAPRVPAGFAVDAPADVFGRIRRGDVLLHHPYESFQSVVEFLQQASRDPDVVAIKMTLYRIGAASPIVKALMDAISSGKHVTVLMELRARFDEEINIRAARTLEKAGARVVFGMADLKVHAKICLVVRREDNVLRRYLHLSSGNYNPITARIYTDVGLCTADEVLAADAEDLFSFLTGESVPQRFRKMLVAPISLRDEIVELISREIRWRQCGQEARLIFKMNALVDRELIQLLYRASQEGVRIDLIVRGICCLRPGIPGISENIRVRSVVGRFLEHSRVYYFRNGSNEEVYLGSADLMPRNLDRRVEVLFPVEDASLLRRLRDEILDAYLRDNVKARELGSDGNYRRPPLDSRTERCNSQELLTKNPVCGE